MSFRRRKLETEPEEQIIRREVASIRRVAFISPEKIFLLMDSEQPLRLRLAIARSILPVLIATLSKRSELMSSTMPVSRDEEVSLNMVLEYVKQYLELVDPEAPSILEETCKKHYGKDCKDVPVKDSPMIPIKMLKDGVSLDIVVETMAILYSTLAYALRLVSPETEFLRMLKATSRESGIG
ncbi:MAG: hypothetical protein JHC33_13210 [Ignisphaera sp.]|nr:hypothetical protein [Ignisphaera sp.]